MINTVILGAQARAKCDGKHTSPTHMLRAIPIEHSALPGATEPQVALPVLLAHPVTK